MNKKYDISPDFEEVIRLARDTEEETLELFQQINMLGNSLLKKNETDNKVKITKEKIKSFDGEEIEIQVFEPHNIEDNAPCLVYYHGGGFILRVFEYQISFIREYSLKVGCKVIFVDYRLAMDYPFPTAVEDCYTALKWIYENANNLGIDTNKIAVGGDSAGGALAAAVTQMVRDRKGPTICFQMLCYPVTDSRQITESAKMFDDTPVWDSNLNALMWEFYLKNGDKGIREYASPMEAKSFKDLPPAYVEVAEFDPLRDEGIAYANALSENDVEVKLVQTKRTVHAYDMIAESNITKESIARRISVLKEAFKNK
ncbi:alpha/beta hydrolase [Clostridium sp. DJ247]|uniref:alpha/beta hydrolase n=1 Tax=Clostridium sp. DJ247 TaxID=2726188 RepID=UPI0016250696|nr:alpha/beta hydrolase [Clostridium sp. DJ247]MBC2580960.1 alpha/beta hydrolase [Clostridium sp. DJ247]